MADTNANNRKATIVTTDDPKRLSPIEASIMDWCNMAHRVRAREDDQELAAVSHELHRLLARYDETDGDSHAHPAWARPNQRALVQSALGRTVEAIETEAIALKYADTPRRIEVSAGNIAARYLRLGDANRAIPYFLQAWDAAPYSVPVLLTGATAFHRTGRHEEAESVFASLLEIAPMLGPDSDLAAWLAHDEELRDLADESEALSELFVWLDSIGGAA
ncbi:MAG: tetratricopeptide repeat protein [Planctomycetota bacterium]